MSITNYVMYLYYKCKCFSWCTVYSVRSVGANVPTAGRPVAGEVGHAADRRSLRYPDLIFCCILEDNFLVNIFLILKEDAITSSITSETGTNQSVKAFTLKEDGYPSRMFVRFQRPHPWPTVSWVYNSFNKTWCFNYRKDYSSLDTTFNAK